MFSLLTLVIALTFLWKIWPFSKETVAALGIFWIAAGVLTLQHTLGPDLETPPRLFYVVIVALGFVAWIGGGPLGKVLAEHESQNFLIGFQVYRMGTEYLLTELEGAKLIPLDMTYFGSNYDIIIGLLALLYILFIRKWSDAPKLRIFQIFFNILGLILLVNIMTTGLLSAPSILQQWNFDRPNMAIFRFPYIYLPLVHVLVALCLHIISLRQILEKD